MPTWLDVWITPFFLGLIVFAVILGVRWLNRSRPSSHLVCNDPDCKCGMVAEADEVS